MTVPAFGFSISPGPANGVAGEAAAAEELGYSIWEGWEVRGWPVATILRGKVVVEDGQLLGSPADGQFITRKVLPDMLARPVA